MRNFQFYYQNVHCVNQIRKVTTKKHHCIFRSRMKIILKLHLHFELKHDYALIKRKIFFKCVNKLTNTFAFEFINFIYSIELIKSNKQNHNVRSLISFAYFANFKFFETN
jgi:hypothetical protein